MQDWNMSSGCVLGAGGGISAFDPHKSSLYGRPSQVPSHATLGFDANMRDVSMKDQPGLGVSSLEVCNFCLCAPPTEDFTRAT